MKYIPYAAQWIDKQDKSAVNKVLGSDYLTQGPGVADFEKAVAAHCGAKYAVGVSSGTAALHIACLAAGLAEGDEGITSPVTFVASSNAILYCGSRPVFADIEKGTVCIDPEEIKKMISGKTRVIIPVHFAGRPCAMEAIHKIAQKNRITVIEDACHALGAEYRGTKIGSCRYSDMAVFSFHPVKHITTGEGGMILTNSKKLYQKMLLLRSHGITRDPELLTQNPGPWYYQMQVLGFNYRLTDMQSVLGLSQLKKLSKFIKIREKIVRMYNKGFSGLPGVKLLEERADTRSSHHLYIIRLPLDKFNVSKKTLFAEYMKRGILVNLHYIPVYHQPYYQKIGYRVGLCPQAERYYREALTLPLYPKMSDRDVRRVIIATQELVNKYAK